MKRLACGSLAIAALVAFAIVVGFGCGTMENMAGYRDPAKPFGGVASDLKPLASGNILGILVVPDIPFSLVGDVVTLPRVLKRSCDPLQVGICYGEKLEFHNGKWKINPALVLREIPLNSPIDKAETVMKDHGFFCSHGSTENDEQPVLKEGTYLHATTFCRLSFRSVERITVTVFYEENKVTDVDVVVQDE